jgi:hypothetical protein
LTKSVTGSQGQCASKETVDSDIDLPWSAGEPWGPPCRNKEGKHTLSQHSMETAQNALITSVTGLQDQCASTDIVNSDIDPPWSAGEPWKPPMLEQGGETHSQSKLNGNSSECTEQDFHRITASMSFSRHSNLRCKPTLECRRALDGTMLEQGGQTHF